MKNISIMLILVAAFILPVSISVAQTTKAAFVDSEKILGELPEAQKASKELEALVKAWQDSVAAMNTDFQAQVAEYQKQMSVMAQPKKDAEEKRLNDLNTRIREFRGGEAGCKDGGGGTGT